MRKGEECRERVEEGVEDWRKGRRVEEGEYGGRGGRGLETGGRVQGEEALYSKGWREGR